MDDFNGKVAVITGGASGIGLAYAESFGAAGTHIVLADVEKPRLDQAVEHLTRKGITAIGVTADVSKYEDVEALARQTLDRFGKVNLVFNNAGVSITGPTWLQSLDDWHWVYGVNIFGIIHGIKAFMPILLEQKEPAHIINTASLASFNGTGDHAPYCSSKAAALSISQALYSEVRALMVDIGVSVVCPGMVDTDINKSWRIRPKEHTPWSDREFKDGEFMQRSNAFQSAGIPPVEVAEATFQAVREKRFYVFTQAGWHHYLDAFLMPPIRAEDPPVLTWGTDLRPEDQRETHAWVPK